MNTKTLCCNCTIVFMNKPFKILFKIILFIKWAFGVTWDTCGETWDMLKYHWGDMGHLWGDMGHFGVIKIENN